MAERRLGRSGMSGFVAHRPDRVHPSCRPVVDLPPPPPPRANECVDTSPLELRPALATLAVGLRRSTPQNLASKRMVSTAELPRPTGANATTPSGHRDPWFPAASPWFRWRPTSMRPTLRSAPAAAATSPPRCGAAPADRKPAWPSTRVLRPALADHTEHDGDSGVKSRRCVRHHPPRRLLATGGSVSSCPSAHPQRGPLSRLRRRHLDPERSSKSPVEAVTAT